MDKAKYVGMAAAVVFLDQWVGAYLMTVLQPSESRWEQYFCHPLLSFTPSLAWGWLPWGLEVSVGLGVALGIAAALGVGCAMRRTKGLAAWAWALLLGGLLVSIVDRLRFHAVMDFVACGRATFNGGDGAGAIAFLLLMFSGIARLRRWRKNNRADFSRWGQGSV